MGFGEGSHEPVPHVVEMPTRNDRRYHDDLGQGGKCGKSCNKAK